MISILAAIRLIRPLNGLVAVLSVMVGVYLATGEIETFYPALAALFCLTSFGYALNDYFDYRADAKTKPKRPLPAGQLSRGAALALAFVYLLFGVAIACTQPLSVALYLLALAAALWLYAWKLSAVLVISNLLVALMCSSAFLLSSLLAAPDPRGRELIAMAVIFSFLHHLGRETVKDIEDINGDIAVGRRTAPARWGIAAAGRLAALTFVILIVITYLAYVVLNLSTSFAIVVTIGVNVPLLLVAIALLRGGFRTNPAVPVCITKAAMLPGLLALLLAR